MTIRGIAFDLEGTLVDIEIAHHEAHLLAAFEVGVTLDREQAIARVKHFIGGPDEKVAEEIWEISGRQQTPEFIAARKREHFERLSRSLTFVPRPGVSERLGWLAQNGFRMAVGSLTTRERVHPLLEGAGLLRFFPPGQIVCREDVAAPKPAPDVFLETARRMGIRPEEQIVFEDSPRGIAAAVAADSAAAVAVPTTNHLTLLRELVSAGAFRTYLDWQTIDLPLLVRLAEHQKG